ncbi:inner centromere protein A isoform X2 [Aplysia californica]|uniref:Inner centromere protein A isoform X2 n=1 Tax=Aplysia californica TaxID=6500 RepID=A0ABM1A9P4_APLCA|nr:inner centromere protein A isoform X2 [Aplysia californica]
MANSAVWFADFPAACLSLVAATERLCHDHLLEKLEEIREGFQFVEEIVEEASKSYANDSPKLKQLPKTPSLKQKAQKRTRKNEPVIEEDFEDGNVSRTVKSKPTQLKFDLTCEEVQEAEEEKPRNTGRPTRKCSKVVHQQESPKTTRATRQSRRAANKKQETSSANLDAVVKSESENTIISSTDAATVSNDENVPPPAARVKLTSNLAKSDVCGEDTAGEDWSPSVKDRANAYETMLKQRTSNSPVKLVKAGTPGSCGKPVSSSKVSRKEDAGMSQSPITGSGSGGKRKSSKSSGSRLSRRSQHRKSSSSGKQMSKDEKSGVKKPVRTRLRLKKQQKEDEPMDTSDKSENVKEKRSAGTPVQTEGSGDVPADVVESSEADSCSAEEVEEEVKFEPPTPARDVMNETEIIVTEVFDIEDKAVRLKEYEKVQTKTTPVKAVIAITTTAAALTTASSTPASAAGSGTCLSSDQGFNDGDDEEEEEEEEEENNDNNSGSGNHSTSHNNAQQAPAVGRSTRTRTRVQQKEMESLMSVSTMEEPPKAQPAASKVNSTFTKDSSPEPQQEEPPVRSTRTRARAVKQQALGDDAKVDDGEKETRNRDEKGEDVPAKAAASTEDSSPVQRSTRTRTRAQKEKEEAAPAENQSDEPSTRTRTRQKKAEVNALLVESLMVPKPSAAQPAVSTHNRLGAGLSDDEVVAGSPANVSKAQNACGGKKRLLQERGLSPRPKRSRSYVGDPNHMHSRSPLSTSSPIKTRGGESHDDEERDDVTSPFSPRRSPRAFQFHSAQLKTSGFLNRTPSFAQNSRVYSFLSATPSYRSNNVLTSFLKRNTPPTKQNNQVIQEQKKMKLLEKESKDRERLKKAAELRKRKIEEQRRQREEKEKKVAEAREQKLRKEQEQKERINKKLEEKAVLKAKMTEERIKEERERQKMRLKKQMEADARRKQEEEERVKKLIELEEEAKEQEKYMQRKKEHEELERKRWIEEEKKRQDERKAELEQRRLEDLARLKKQEEERERERERIRLEKDRQMANERAERERVEKEKREEKERKIREEMEKLKAMEKERQQKNKMASQKAHQNQKEMAELQQMIDKHNATLNKAPAPALNTTQTLASNTSVDKSNSYDMTPVKKKVYKPSPNPDNYDIDDKGSDDSTDDDDAPKKKIPEWALGNELRIAIIQQFSNPPDVEAIFRTQHIDAPNLELLFPMVKKYRFKKRTSSAVWTSPVLKH